MPKQQTPNNKLVKAIGGETYLNKNCWLVKNLGSLPYTRCQYCELRFRNCLFLQYQVISVLLICFALALFYILDKTLSFAPIAIVFAIVIVYGYFFNKSTEKIIKSNFFEKKAKEELKTLSNKLEDKVVEQTKEIKTKAERMIKLLEMRSSFLDIASHQLRTPTSVIRGTLAMMRDGDMDKMKPAERSRFIDGMYQKSIKLEEIINDILMASEMDTSSEMKITTDDQIDLTDLVNKIISEHIFDAQAKKLQLFWQKPNEALMIKGSLKYIKETIDHILDNAIKYTIQGAVTVALTKNVDKVLLTIQDTGIGIPKADQAKVFNKFVRAKNAKNAYTDGSGLGLFIVKEVIDQHPGAKVWLESQENKGTKVYLEFTLDK